MLRSGSWAAASIGSNVMYFGDGQGSAPSANAHHGADPADPGSPALIWLGALLRTPAENTVVGFTGPGIIL